VFPKGICIVDSGSELRHHRRKRRHCNPNNALCLQNHLAKGLEAMGQAMGHVASEAMGHVVSEEMGQEMDRVHSSKHSSNCHRRVHKCLVSPNCNHNHNHHAQYNAFPRC
jgi:hypothetical protein